MTLAPNSTGSATVALGWFFPYRDYMGEVVGNHYSTLVADAEEAAWYAERYGEGGNVVYSMGSPTPWRGRCGLPRMEELCCAEMQEFQRYYIENLPF